MKAYTISTQPSTRKTSFDSWIDVKNCKDPALQPWMESDILNGLKAFSNREKNACLLERISRPNTLSNIMLYAVENLGENPIAKKALKLVVGLIRLKPKHVKINPRNSRIVANMLPQLAEIDRHGLFLCLRLMETLLKAHPLNYQLFPNLFLKRLGSKISRIYKIQQHKKKLKIVLKILEHLPQKKKADFVKGIVNIQRDLSSGHYKEEIMQMMELAPKGFTSPLVEFLSSAVPEQTMIPHIGKLLHKLMKDQKVAQKSYNEGLQSFFDGMLRSVHLFWSNTRFILVFIADFFFVWSKLKFKPEFIGQLVKYMDQNPAHIQFVEDRMELIDRFLMINYIKNDFKFARNLKSVQNSDYVASRILKNCKPNQEDIIQIDSFNVIGNFLLRKAEVMHKTGSGSKFLFVSEIESRHLLQNLKGDNSQYFFALGSKGHQKDIGVLGNHRNRKLLKAFNVGSSNSNMPNYSKSRVKRLSFPNRKNPLRVNFSLKREGFDQDQFVIDGFRSMRREGKSSIRLVEIMPDHGRGRNLASKTELKFYNQSKGKKCLKVLYEQEFDFEILDFTFIGNHVHFWGHSVYGIIDIENTFKSCDYGPSVLNNSIKLNKIKVSLSFFKHFHHCIVHRLVPFDNQYIGIIPRNESKTLQLYNLKKDYFSFVKLSKQEMDTLRHTAN